MRRLEKVRATTELEDVKSVITNYDDIPLKATYDMNGNILSIETDNLSLITELKRRGLVER